MINRQSTELWRSTIKFFYAVFILLILIPGGSVRAGPLYLFSILFFTLTATALATSRTSKATQRIITPASIVMIILFVWVVLQSIGVTDNPLAHPVWSASRPLSGYLQSSISVAPADTLATLVGITLPFAVFITGILVFKNDLDVIQFLNYLVAVATFGAIVGIIQLHLFPQTIMFFDKKYYIDSLTAYFVNRNTSGTYLAIHLILACGLTYHYVRAHGQERFTRLALRSSPATPTGIGKVLFAGSSAGILLTALLLTKSRASLGAGMIGLALSGAILVYFRTKSESGPDQRWVTPKFGGRLARWLKVGTPFLVCIFIATMLGGRAVLRSFAVSGDERFCILPGAIRLLRDNWLSGTGFGTFADVFPAYRPSGCAIDGIWDRAHNFFLEGWITGGVLSPVLMAIVISWIVWKLVIGVRSRVNYRWVSVAGLGIVLTVILHSLVDFSLQIPGFNVVFSAMLAGILSVALRRTERRSH